MGDYTGITKAVCVIMNRNDEKTNGKGKFMEMLSIEQELKGNSYPGRGIIIGKTPDGQKGSDSLFYYGTQRKQPQPDLCRRWTGNPHPGFDESKLTDPSLIIYAPVRVLGNKTIVTNGDQTDTIYEGMDRQLTFEQSLRSREFERTLRTAPLVFPESCTLETETTIMRCQS